MKNIDNIINEASRKFSINRNLVVRYIERLGMICEGFFENRDIYRHNKGMSLRGDFEIIYLPHDDQKLAEMTEYVLNHLFGINTYIKRGQYVCDDENVNPLYYNKEYYYQIVLFY